jgi:hypothetical protein
VVFTAVAVALGLAGRTIGRPVEAVRAAHSGIVGDYLLWIVAGTVAIGGVWAFTLTGARSSRHDRVQDEWTSSSCCTASATR